MSTIVQVPLDAELVESLRQIAGQEGVSLENVVSDLVRKYLRDARRQKIRVEVEHYQAMHADLREKHFGQHVAIHDGRLVDHDPDPVALVRRIRQRFGRRPILITQVGDEPIRELVIRSPRLVRAE